MIKPIGLETRVVIGELGFLVIIYDCRLALVIDYLDYFRSAEVGLEALGMDAPILGYDFATQSVEGVTTAVFPGQFRSLDRLGNEFNRSYFTAVSPKWFPGKTTRKAVCVDFVGGETPQRDPRSHSHSTATGGDTLMQGAVARAALAEFRAECALVDVEAPPLYLLTSGWRRV